MLLTAAVLGVFGQVVGFYLVHFDDDAYIAANAKVLQGLSFETVRWAFTSLYQEHWHPLTWLSHLLDYSLYGPDPRWHHLTSLLLHLANTLLVFVALRRMTGDLWRSAFVAALFALHPAHVETVAWISDRKDLLAGTMCFGVLALYPGFVSKRGWARFLALVLLYVLALMSKMSSLLIPVGLLLLDFWPLARHRQAAGDLTRAAPLVLSRQMVLEKLALVAILIPALFFALLANVMGDARALDRALTTNWDYISTAFVSCWFYIGKLFWPVHLATPYPAPVVPPLWLGLLAGGALLVVTVGIARRARTHTYLLVGWVWYLVMLVPSLGLVMLGTHIRADRYTYLPYLGLFVLITWGAGDLLGNWRHRQRALRGAAVIILAACALLSWRQVGFWRDSQTLFEHAIAVTDGNTIACNNLGATRHEMGDLKGALHYFRLSLEADPDEYVALNNMGVILMQMGQLDSAEVSLRRAIAVGRYPTDAHNNLGEVLMARGHHEDAIAQFQSALLYKPERADARFNLGSALAQLGRFDEAETELNIALTHAPDSVEVHNNLGSVLLSKGAIGPAIQQYTEALKLKPDHVESLLNMGIALERLGQLEQAEEVLRRVLLLYPGHPAARRQLDALRRLQRSGGTTMVPE
ncbi:MAG: tetratricopeptide repeat protein [Pseudomonadota bacterium]